jgi:hypothetical protein
LDFHEYTTEKIFRAIVIAQRNFSHISGQYPPAPDKPVFSIYSIDYNTPIDSPQKFHCLKAPLGLLLAMPEQFAALTTAQQRHK